MQDQLSDLYAQGPRYVINSQLSESCWVLMELKYKETKASQLFCHMTIFIQRRVFSLVLEVGGNFPTHLKKYWGNIGLQHCKSHVFNIVSLMCIASCFYLCTHSTVLATKILVSIGHHTVDTLYLFGSLPTSFHFG